MLEGERKNYLESVTIEQEQKWSRG